jgi:hypothetical protein
LIVYDTIDITVDAYRLQGMDPIDYLCYQILLHLQQGQLFELQIPKLKMLSLNDDEHEIDFAEGPYDIYKLTCRKLTSTKSTHKYVQFIALASLVGELRSGIFEIIHSIDQYNLDT